MSVNVVSQPGPAACWIVPHHASLMSLSLTTAHRPRHCVSSSLSRLCWQWIPLARLRHPAYTPALRQLLDYPKAFAMGLPCGDLPMEGVGERSLLQCSGHPEAPAPRVTITRTGAPRQGVLPPWRAAEAPRRFLIEVAEEINDRIPLPETTGRELW